MRLSLIALVLSFFMLAPTAEANRVKELRKMRKEMRQMIKAKKVQLEFGEDSIGEYMRVGFRGKLIDKLNEFEFTPDIEGVDSGVYLTAGEDGKVLSLTIYTKDMERWTPGADLQTSEGRTFPNFYGTKHESLWGFEIKDKVQLYLDPGTGIFGVYVNVDGVRNVMNKINEFKNKIPVIKDIVPNINSLPVPVKIKKKKVMKAYALSHDENGERGGVILLADYNAIKSLKDK
jgi:hypothetical protein